MAAASVAAFVLDCAHVSQEIVESTSFSGLTAGSHYESLSSWLHRFLPFENREGWGSPRCAAESK